MNNYKCMYSYRIVMALITPSFKINTPLFLKYKKGSNRLLSFKFHK